MPRSISEFCALVTSRRILYFSCEELKTDVPHYFICICNYPGDNYNFSCCTSQFETVKRLIERGKFPQETLVYIPGSDPNNPFTKDTYVNCNEWWPFSIDELWTLYQSNKLKIIDDLLPLESFEQILIGFNASRQIEEDLKEALPDINDFL